MSKLKWIDFPFIPEKCIEQILTKYLQLKDVAHLDIAMCNYQGRHHFLKFLSRSSTFDNITDDTSWKTDSGIMQWLQIRNVQLMKLSLTAQFIRHSKEDCVAAINSLSIAFASQLLYFTYDNNGFLSTIVDILISGLLPTICHIPIGVLISFLSACQNLNSLDISNCRSMTSTGMIAIAPHLCKLKCVDISFTDTTDAGVIALAEHCPHLVNVLLNGLNINDASIIALARYCKHIQSLSLDVCEITDSSLMRIADELPDIISISVQDCHLLTNIGFTSLAQKMSKLKYFNCEGTQIRFASILITLIKNNPLLEYICAEKCGFAHPDLCEIALTLANFCMSIEYQHIHITQDYNEEYILSNIFIHARLYIPKSNKNIHKFFFKNIT